MRKYVRAMSTVAILFASSTMIAAQVSETDPFIGTWKLNVAKSKLSQASTPKTQTVTIAPNGRTNVEEVLSDGTSRAWSFTPSGDGAVPIEGLENSTVTYKRTGNIAEYDWDFNGKKGKGRTVLSSNGKTATYTFTGADKDGRPVHNVSIYDRASMQSGER